MNNIQTYGDLLVEKKRLEASLAHQKGVILQDFIALREEYKPTLQLLSSIGKITKRSWTNPLISLAMNVAGGLFLRNMALTGSSKIASIVLPMLSRKVSGWLSKSKGSSLFRKLTGGMNNGSNGH